jgi:hypothetical protein
VSDGALRQRVLNAEGAICRNPTNKHQSQHDQSVRKEENEFTGYDLDSLPMRYARMAVLDLEKIETSHPDRNRAFDYVIEWITKAKEL